jgi:hypothetical protein
LNFFFLLGDAELDHNMKVTGELKQELELFLNEKSHNTPRGEGATTLGITTFSITAFSVMTLIVLTKKCNTQHNEIEHNGTSYRAFVMLNVIYVDCHCAECH